MQKLVINLRDYPDRESLQHALKENLNQPDGYGGNLDALYDVLTAWPDDLRITVVREDALPEKKRMADRLLRVLRDAARENRAVSVSVRSTGHDDERKDCEQ